MKQKRKLGRKLLSFLLTLAMVMGLMPGMSLTAYADNTETKLTTIKPTSVSTYNQNPDGFVTVTLEGNMDYSTDWQAWIAKAFKSASVTVVGKEDYAITKCIFHNAESTTKTVTEKPFMVDLTFSSGDINRVGSIEVYGTVKPANPATVVGTATVDNDGNTVDLSNYVSLNGATGAVTYEISGDAKGCTLQGSVLTSGSSAGTVTVNVSVAADDNCRSLAAKPITVTINKTNAVPATVAANNRTYDGTEKPLVTVTGTPTGGTMQYVLGTDATTAPTTGYTTSIPTAINAGTYYVWYKVIGDENHNDSDPKCVSVTISATGSPDNQNPGKKDPNNQNPGKKDPNNGGNNQGGGNRKDKKTEKITISKRPSSVKAKVKKSKVTVSWKKIKKNKAGKKLLKQIKSIQVQYSTDKTFKKDVKTKTVGKKKTKVKLKLQKKTTYYVRVRYKGANGFSKWSKVKKVKTKK